MLFKDALNQVEGFRYLLEWITPQSEAGRKRLYGLSFMTDAGELEAEYQKIEQVMGAIWPDYTMDIEDVEHFELHRLKDIGGTLDRLKAGEVLGDIELFEIKEFALLSLEIRQLMVEKGLSVFRLADLAEVVDILDPERLRMPYFYIYDNYLPELAEVRADMQREKDEKVLEGLRVWEMKLEDEVRERLAGELKGYARELSETLDKLAHLDLLVAKVEFARYNFLARPVIRKSKIVYEELTNIELWHRLGVIEGKGFQPVDVEVEPWATVVTGANMAGKSVLLKSLEIAQYLAQFGFFIPAVGDIVLVDEVITCIGDGQNRQEGLSSFGAEMMKINRMIQVVKEGKKVLVLIDEPARTTNPVEGKAIVNALVDFLSKHKVLSVVTTHYSGLSARSRRLRVKGLVDDTELPGNVMNIADVRQRMDYSLIEDAGNDVPHEALRVAELLGVDADLLKKARKYLEKEMGTN